MKACNYNLATVGIPSINKHFKMCFEETFIENMPWEQNSPNIFYGKESFLWQKKNLWFEMSWRLETDLQCNPGCNKQSRE